MTFLRLLNGTGVRRALPWSSVALVLCGLLVGWFASKIADHSVAQSPDSSKFADLMRETGHDTYIKRLEAGSEYRWLLLFHDYSAATELLSRCAVQRIHRDDIRGYMRTLWYSVGTAPLDVRFPVGLSLRTAPGIASETLADTLVYDRQTSSLLNLRRIAKFALSTTLSDDEKTTVMRCLFNEDPLFMDSRSDFTLGAGS